MSDHEKKPTGPGLEIDSQVFANQVNSRVTAIEEAFISKRPAYETYTVEALETGDGPLYRAVSPDGKTISPLFFSENCLTVYITRMPLLTMEEWDAYPVAFEPTKLELPKEANETNP